MNVKLLKVVRSLLNVKSLFTKKKVFLLTRIAIAFAISKLAKFYYFMGNYAVPASHDSGCSFVCSNGQPSEKTLFVICVFSPSLRLQRGPSRMVSATYADPAHA